MLSSRLLRTTLAAVVAAILTLSASGSAQAADPKSTPAARAAATWLAQQFTDHFDYPGSTYFDGGTTADSIYALAAAGVDKARIDESIAYFEKHVDDYTSVHDKSGKPGPYDGSIGKAVVAALVTGADPTHFGGYDLLRALKTDQCTSASQPKNAKDYSTPTCPAPGSARNSYTSISESLAILAEARGAAKYGATYAPDRAATAYFLSLQCPDGGFTSASVGAKPCTSDPDATGYAMMALQALGGRSAALDRAAHWLISVRNSDGSWTSQHVHNVDSTGLAAAALAAHGDDIGTSTAWLDSQQVTTGPATGKNATRGALEYHGHFDAKSSVKATADGILGMVPAGSLATLTVASAAPAAAPAASARHIGVVVQSAPGHVSTGCVAPGGTGLQLLEGHHQVVLGAQQYSGFVLKIDGTGTARPDNTHYWAYWHSDGTGAWAYSSSGAATSHPQAGTVEGWTYVDGQNKAPRPPGASYAKLCGRLDAQPQAAGRSPVAHTEAATAGHDDSGFPAWGTVLAVVVVVALGGAAFLLARRRRVS